METPFSVAEIFERRPSALLDCKSPMQVTTVWEGFVVVLQPLLPAWVGKGLATGTSATSAADAELMARNPCVANPMVVAMVDRRDNSFRGRGAPISLPFINFWFHASHAEEDKISMIHTEHRLMDKDTMWTAIVGCFWLDSLLFCGRMGEDDYKYRDDVTTCDFSDLTTDVRKF